jgi:pimeloyl-ACP methyl ester carboxylesterase
MMPAVFVHGVPDTYRVWDRLRKSLSRTDVITLSLPGFGSPLPEGFTATKEEYVNWIICQLEEQGEPVDLVGHDWGCIMVARVASLRPDLVRTWAAGDAPVNRDYVWHPLAKIWQTPVTGEEWMRDLKPDEFTSTLRKHGVPADLAPDVVSRMDSTMKDCILRLYRSAVNVGGEWQPGLADIASPGLVFWGIHDIPCPVEFADSLGKDTRAARVLKLDGQHWTPVERAKELAAAFEQHWKTTETTA